MNDDLTTMRLKIEGQVQGVGFRDYAVREAEALGLNGWVRNLAGGAVEAVVSGPTKAIEAFVGACIKGPPAARVTGIELSTTDPPAEPGFRRLPMD